MGHYRRFVRNFSQFAAPLNRLAGKNVPFEWTGECEAAFSYLKQVLISSRVVTLPNFALPFKIYTDASKDAVGGVLAQDVNGLERVIANASLHTLSASVTLNCSHCSALTRT